MIKRVDFLLPISSQYGALHHFTKKIYEAFVRRGLTCRLLNPEEHFSVPMADPPDMTFAVNGVPHDPEGNLLCDLIHIPHLCFIVDPPFRFLELLRSPHIAIACDDRFNCEVLRSNGFERTCFFPYGVEPELSPSANDERPFDVTMIASYIDYQANKALWPSKYAPPLVEAMEEAVVATVEEQGLSFIAALMNALNLRIVRGEMEGVEIDLVRILIDLELYLKGWDRVQLVKAVTDAEVHVIGGVNTGWTQALAGMDNVHFHPSVSYEETLEIMKKSKIVLNSSIKNKEGASERVFSTLATGALPLTTQTCYLAEHFIDEESILFYQPNAYDRINGKINKILANEKLTKTIVEKGRAEVMQAHTWDSRVNELFKKFNL